MKLREGTIPGYKKLVVSSRFFVVFRNSPNEYHGVKLAGNLKKPVLKDFSTISILQTKIILSNSVTLVSS